MNTKKLFYGMSITLSILVVAILVYAYSGENPAVHGHAVSELGGVDMESKNFSGDWAFSGTVTAAEPTDDHNLATKGWVEANAGGGGSAYGSDMFTNKMDELGLFSPHTNDCDVDEAFVEVYDGEGYCIEKNERSSKTFILARKDCLSDGKRLPEVAEWQHACNNRGSLGLNNMINNAWEWAGNFPKFSIYGSTNYGTMNTVIGYDHCAYTSWIYMASYSKNEGSTSYRCVR